MDAIILLYIKFLKTESKKGLTLVSLKEKLPFIS